MTPLTTLVIVGPCAIVVESVPVTAPSFPVLTETLFTSGELAVGDTFTVTIIVG